MIGKHKGIWGYTIGQRKGLGVGGGAAAVRHFASMRRPIRVVAGPESSLYRGELVAAQRQLVEHSPPRQILVRLEVKIRYRNPAVPATVEAMSDGRVRVSFDEPQRAIARGQWAVFYDGDILVAGGVIGDS